MRFTKQWILFILSLLAAHDASASGKLQRFRWSAKIWKPLNLFLPTRVNANKRVAADQATLDLGLLRKNVEFKKAGSELVGRSAQYVEGAKVQGSWLQTIYTKSGQAIYSIGSVLEQNPDELAMQVRMMKGNQFFVEQRLKMQNSDFASAAKVNDPQIEIAIIEGKMMPIWVIDFISRNEEDSLRARLKADGELIDVSSVAVAFADGKAVVFPDNPRSGTLEEVSLPNMTGDGTLTGLKQALSSAIDLPVNVPDLFFNFQTNDRRFDQVQAYYYVDKALRWFHEKLQADVGSVLQIRVNIGANGVSNAAFYHDKTIYLGSGDDKVYKGILRDPSIVIHETTHAVIDVFAGLPPDGEGGAFNEGFADFFAALILNNPNVGEASYQLAPFRRSLKNDLHAYTDFSDGAIYKNGSIIGGTLWDIKESIGSERVAQLAFRTLVRLGSGAKFNDFVPALLHACAGYCTDAESNEVQKILVARGWRVLQDDMF